MPVREPDGLSLIVQRAVEEEKARFTANFAQEAERVLKRRRGSFWPRRTGFSGNRFVVEDAAGSDSFPVLNAAAYAKYVNGRRTYPNGGDNPNYRAAQRTLERHMGEILEKASGDG